MILHRSDWLVALVGSGLLMTAVRAEVERGGGPIGSPPSGECISPADRGLVRQLVDNYERQFGPRAVVAGPPTPPKLTFYPLAGRLWNDLFTFNYVDLDATAGFQAWDCSDFTYDGHNGNDTVLRSFGEQFIGVPVFAAQDGVVIATHDGEDDMNTVWAGQPANFVIVDHGSGREGWYFHLKKNSVAVSPNDVVSAGHQVGLCASSGVSTGPHLHFELRDSGTPYEPFAGACRAGESGWVSQPPTTLTPYLHDFGITTGRHQHIRPVARRMASHRAVRLHRRVHPRLVVRNRPASGKHLQGPIQTPQRNPGHPGPNAVLQQPLLALVQLVVDLQPRRPPFHHGHLAGTVNNQWCPGA